MKANLLLTLIAGTIMMSSCSNSSNPQEPEVPKVITPYQKDNNNPSGHISFDYTAIRLDKQKDIIEVKASLVNQLTDTVYYLSTSCNGDQYSLIIDTMKYSVVPLTECAEIVPVLKKIPPMGRYTFNAKLKANTIDEKIRLGFDLFKAEKGTALSGLTFNNIHRRSMNDKNILWTDERLIE